MSIELAARVRDPEPSRRPIEQPNSELGLELLDAVAQSRLGQPQRASGRSEPAPVHHLYKVEKVIQVEHAPSIVQTVGRCVSILPTS
jgi:hypothetical protein